MMRCPSPDSQRESPSLSVFVDLEVQSDLILQLLIRHLTTQVRILTPACHIMGGEGDSGLSKEAVIPGQEDSSGLRTTPDMTGRDCTRVSLLALLRNSSMEVSDFEGEDTIQLR